MPNAKVSADKVEPLAAVDPLKPVGDPDMPCGSWVVDQGLGCVVSRNEHGLSYIRALILHF